MRINNVYSTDPKETLHNVCQEYLNTLFCVKNETQAQLKTLLDSPNEVPEKDITNLSNRIKNFNNKIADIVVVINCSGGLPI